MKEDSNLKFLKAKNRVERIKSFYWHITIYITVNLVITILKLIGGFGNFNAFINTLLSIDVLSSWSVWGIILGMHGLSLVFGQPWKERQIEKLMKKELSRNKD